MPTSRRIDSSIRRFLSWFTAGVERQSPEALFELEQETVRGQIANYNHGLTAHADLCERLMAHVKQLEQEERELRTKTAANLRASNRGLASQQALRLQAVQLELIENGTQLESAEATYKELLRTREVAVKAAQARMAELKNSAGEEAVKRAGDEILELASKVTSSGDTLARLHAMVEEERTKADGRARIARPSADPDGQITAAEQALADFEAKEDS